MDIFNCFSFSSLVKLIYTEQLPYTQVFFNPVLKLSYQAAAHIQPSVAVTMPWTTFLLSPAHGLLEGLMEHICFQLQLWKIHKMKRKQLFLHKTHSTSSIWISFFLLNMVTRKLKYITQYNNYDTLKLGVHNPSRLWEYLRTFNKCILIIFLLLCSIKPTVKCPVYEQADIF